jgi:hypothetical protein
MTDHTWKMKLMLSKGDKIGFDMSGGISESTKQALMNVFQKDFHQGEVEPDQPSLDQLVQMATAWSDARGILLNGRVESQYLKLMEEAGELASSIAKQRCVKDDIGDILVVLNNLAVMSDTTLQECLAVSYEAIRHRRGFLNGQGVFIKEEEAMR